MFVDLSPASKALRRELREYFPSVIGDEDRKVLVHEREGGPTFSRIYRQMGKDGWLGLGWPEEYGGRGSDPEALFVFYDEALRADAPISLVTLNTVAAALMAHGTDAQRDYFLPRIIGGELTFAVGYSEPQAGTDLASLQTRAVLDGDEFVINGQKVYTSGAMHADWIWLAVRTDPDAPRHRGISIIAVPTASEGFSVTPIETVGYHQTTTTYYDDVRVPVDNLIGPLNDGWRLITNQLNHERVALAALGGIANELFDEVVAWTQREPHGDGTVSDIPWVRTCLAEAYCLLSASYLASLRLVARVADNTLTGPQSAGVKVIGSETVVTVYGLLQQVLGAAGLVRPDTDGAVLAGRVELMGRRSQNTTFGGGTNEVMREIVASGALGMTLGRRRPDSDQQKVR